MASIFRTALVVRRAVAGPSSTTASFSTSASRWIADNKNDASPAREHRPRSAVGPNAPGQGSSVRHSKEENLGVAPKATKGSKTQRDAINSAMGVLDSLARDVASSSPPPSPSASASTEASSASSSASTLPGTGSATAQQDSLIPTPSSLALDSMDDSTKGPIYTPTTLPPKSDPTLDFLTNLLMKDGKKAQAQRFTTRTLSIISNITNSNPLPLIHDAISRTAPLVKMRSKKQGGKSLQVPVALTRRQSERKALKWIIDASKKRPDRELERRLAAEILAVVEGTSSAIGKKEEQHKIATVNRANASVRI
ncbi:hypothetical protein NDA11_005402 [Ustilago hordei]|uniref:Small ribosomal subunit protein uS7m n=1 Tax=Ustilago hordei TaxID=120017 RepID=I2FWU6_USTHO|nr:uncharacterized protein UHO2_04211 [Ustilago hordei]KAJ1037148.1 hypothetical protein NDA10_005929 [Ustilago hordei]KAJ1573771.1 hypothetical protein NDA15_003486 [Ustilago hordei]KAJ1579389.1 hypothetical protein NDA11_005402 [Ustilago hordei]KAJ1579667.1 hypothetical protein NDA12_004125 [Ustilago hordei]KAJ1598554.1 hypothetical protein NDA14_003452 [Ustilago hordei]